MNRLFVKPISLYVMIFYRISYFWTKCTKKLLVISYQYCSHYYINDKIPPFNAFLVLVLNINLYWQIKAGDKLLRTNIVFLLFQRNPLIDKEAILWIKNNFSSQLIIIFSVKKLMKFLYFWSTIMRKIDFNILAVLIEMSADLPPPY